MRRPWTILCSVVLVCLWLPAGNAGESKAEVTYTTEKSILYREAPDEPLDDYMKEKCRLDFYHPVGQTGYTTVVWFHGGGLTAGSRYIDDRLKEQGIAVAAASYRLHPKVTCPAYIEDAAAAVAWVFKHVEQYGGDAKRILVSGSSAGGYLTLMVGLDKRWLAKYDIDADRIACLAPFSGQAITHFTIRKERGVPHTQPIIDEFAPLYHVRPDAPPLVLLTGDPELEIWGRADENAYLARMMKVVGHKDTVHYAFQGFGHGMKVPGYEILLKQIKQRQ